MLTRFRLPVALLAVLTIGACANGIAWSHPGGLAQDGCHRVADTDTRHAHAEGTADPASICVEEDGGTVKVPLHAVTKPATEPTIERLTETIAAQALGLVSERDELNARIAELEAELAASHEAHAGTVSDLEATHAALAELEADMAGLRVRFNERPIQRCRNAAVAIVDGRPGWLGDVGVNKEERSELRAACLSGT